MSFFDVFGRDAVFPLPEDVEAGVQYGELGNNLTGTFTVTGWGSEDVTVTVENGDGDPIENATVYFSTDLAGNNLQSPFLPTDSNGQATVKLNPGTYYMHVTKQTLVFENNPRQITVVDL